MQMMVPQNISLPTCVKDFLEDVDFTLRVGHTFASNEWLQVDKSSRSPSTQARLQID